MPELLEVEAYRRLAERVVGSRVAAVESPDAWYLKGGVSAGVLRDALVGAVVQGVRRRGKLLLVDLDRRTVLGLRFGMTGRLVVSGPAAEFGGDPVGRLLYAPRRDRPEHERFALEFSDGSRLTVVDPRRLGAVELDPRERLLGPDAAELAAAQLDRALDSSGAPVKAVLMNQRRLAGLGNLLTDEILWRSHISPWRPARDLDEDERERLLGAIRATLAELGYRGGSHTGDLQSSRRPGGRCPRCGGPLRRDRLGGRTTWWCTAEQR